jgi:hypothetical protein
MSSLDIISNVLLVGAAVTMIWVVFQIGRVKRETSGPTLRPSGAGDLWVGLLFWVAATSTRHAHAWDKWLVEYRRRREEFRKPESWRMRLAKRMENETER